MINPDFTKVGDQEVAQSHVSFQSAPSFLPPELTTSEDKPPSQGWQHPAGSVLD
jgi:hypothetical protein